MEQWILLGAKYVARFLKASEHKVDVGFIAHPSFIESDKLEMIAGPVAIAAAEKDPVSPSGKRQESENILAKPGVPFEITLYGGVEHG